MSAAAVAPAAPAPAGGAEAPAAKAAGPSKLVLVLLLVNTLIGGGGVALHFLHQPTPQPAPPAAKAAAGEGAAAAGEGHGEEAAAAPAADGHGEAPAADGHGEAPAGAAAPAPHLMVRLDTITVRLRNPEVDRYARVTFDLELGGASDNAAFENNKPKLRDAAVSIMSDHSYEDLAGSAGIAKLKEEMLEKATPMFPKGRLHAVYISEFLLQ